MDIEIPAGLVKIDAPDTLHGWCLVYENSPEHLAAMAAAGETGDDEPVDDKPKRRR